MGNASKMRLWCPCQPTSQINVTEEMVGCEETILLQDLLPPVLLDLFTLWRRTGLMRNPKAGLFQGKGKNSTCPVSPGRR